MVGGAVDSFIVSCRCNVHASVGVDNISIEITRSCRPLLPARTAPRSRRNGVVDVDDCRLKRDQRLFVSPCFSGV